MIGSSAGRKPGRKALTVLTRPRRRIVEMRVDRRDLRGPGKWDLPREAPIKHAAEGVDVCPPIHVFTADLLRSDVVNRAHQGTGTGQPGAWGQLLADAEIS